MNVPIERNEIPKDLTSLSELKPDQLDQVAGGSRHKLDIKYGGPDGFYYPPANKS